MSRSAIDYLRHVLDETQYLIGQTPGLNKEQFLRDPTLQRAFARSLEIIGEAVKQLPEDFRQRYAHVDWKAVAGMRDRLIHAYFGVDYEVVWDVVTNKVPRLHDEVLKILESESE